MGKTKRLSEVYLLYLNNIKHETAFSLARFGNVIGSSGSVIPSFHAQIRGRMPITLPHPDVTRYFMTPRECAEVVVQSTLIANAGEIYVLDIGKPIKIRGIALKIIYLSGLKPKTEELPEGDIEICIVGLQPSEKIHEKLSQGMGLIKTAHPRILKAEQTIFGSCELEKIASDLKILQENVYEKNDADGVKEIINELIFPIES